MRMQTLLARRVRIFELDPLFRRRFDRLVWVSGLSRFERSGNCSSRFLLRRCFTLLWRLFWRRNKFLLWPRRSLTPSCQAWWFESFPSLWRPLARLLAEKTHFTRLTFSRWEHQFRISVHWGRLVCGKTVVSVHCSWQHRSGFLIVFRRDQRLGRFLFVLGHWMYNTRGIWINLEHFILFWIFVLCTFRFVPFQNAYVWYPGLWPSFLGRGLRF